MKAIKYHDRTFNTECFSCRAYLSYQMSDVIYNNENIKIPQAVKNDIGEIQSIYYKDMKDTRPYIVCPICNNRHYI